MQKKPHVIVIMADQLRFDALGEHTPNINRLRGESVDFTRAYCASPLCVPARGAFFTGKVPNVNGSLINPWTPEDREHGFVQPGHAHLYQLLEQDWDSWHTGKQHLFTAPKLETAGDNRTHWLQLEQRYEAYLAEHGVRKPGGPAFRGIVPEMRGGAITRKRMYSLPTTGRYEPGLDYFYDGFILQDSLTALRERDQTKPLLLNAMFLAPHPPLDIPEPWYSRVSNVTLPDNVGVWSDKQSPLQLYNLTGALGTRYTRADWERIWPVYLGLVALLDHCVGELVEELKRQGIYDDSLIIFTSDHGDMLGSHCLWQKMCMYEESVRTPLMIKFPTAAAIDPASCDAVVSSVDVLPTLCDYLQLSPPSGLSGQSLMPLVRGESWERERIYIQFDGNGALGNFQRCVIEGRYKLIVDLFKDETYFELYDVVNDPQEMTNLACAPASANEAPRVERMLRALQQHMRDTGDRLTIADDAFACFLENST